MSATRAFAYQKSNVYLCCLAASVIMSHTGRK